MPDGIITTRSAEFSQFPQAFLDEVKARTPLAPLVGRDRKLHRAGREHKVLCPFHEEKTPSLTVYTDHWHCYGCHKRGDAIDWVCKTKGVDFQEAVTRLAAEAGLSLPDHITREKAPSPPKQKSNDADDWRPIVPPPSSPPDPSSRELRCDMLHTYLGADGGLQFYVRRFEARADQGKKFLPLTYGVLNGQAGWHTRAPDTLRQLYGLDKLAARPDVPVIICEGEKAADAAQRMFPDKVCVSWMGGSQAVNIADWTPLADRRTGKTIWPDADNNGRQAAVEIAKHLPDARILSVDNLPNKFDAANLEAGDMGVARPVDPEAWLRDRLPTDPTPDRQPGRLRAFSMDDIGDIKPSDYLIKGLVNRNELSVIVGEPKCGKSFLTMFLGYQIALGQSVFGRRVRQGRVLYLAAEGEHGIAKRLRALRDRYGHTDNFRFVAQPLDLLHREVGHLDAVLELAHEFRPDIIVVDTLNRALGGGSENAAEDMGGFIMNMSQLRHETGAHIAVIHHGTKSSGGTSPRGHGSLTGADDLLLEVTKAADGSRVATVVHARDEADDYRMGFALDQVQMGLDDDGDPITTLVARELPEPAEATRATAQGLANDAELLRREILDLGAGGAEEPAVPIVGLAIDKALRRKVLRQRLIDRGWFGDGRLTPDGKAPTRAGLTYENNKLSALKRRGLICFTPDWVWVP